VAWVLVTLACLLLVPALKRVSDTSCPWDLQAFGGVANYVLHWQFGVADGGPGRCFPSGHALAAFAFISGWFALRSHAPRAARMWLLGVLAFGALFGGAQLLRGAHYPSHTLWSAWICWTTCALLNALFTRPQPARVPVASSR
jgi:membrane-associated PAP2 superfamily phosphatase